MTEMVDAPIVFNHLVALYDRLQAENSDKFEGSMVAEFKALNISQSYYSKLYAYLYELGCIELVRRGNARTKTLLKLRHPPTLEKFTDAYLTNVKPRATLLEQRISHIEGRLPNLDVEQAIASLAVRVSELESSLNDLERRLDNI